MKHLLTIGLTLLMSASLFSQTLVEGFNANFGGFAPGTISGFGADRVNFFLSDDAQEGPMSMAERVASNSWGAGFQIQFDASQDWSAYSQISYWAKSDISTLKNVHVELLSTEDDEQWAFTTNVTLSDTGWQQIVFALDTTNLVEVTGYAGDKALDFANINRVNFIFLNNGDFNEVLCQADNLQLFGADTVAVEGFNSNLGGFAPGTISGFGADRMNFFLTDDAFEGPLAIVEKVGSTAWGAGFQIQFDNPQDWSGDPQLGFHAKADITSFKNIHIELLSAEDDEQWAAANFELTTDWTLNVMALDTSQFVEITGYAGDKKLDLSNINRVNFIILNNGEFNDVTVTIDNLQRGIITGIDPIDDHVAETFALKQNYPNPFNPSTTIEFNLTDRGNVTLDIFDVTGRSVAQLVNEALQPGVYRVNWDGKDASGNQLSSGIYFYRLQQNQLVQSKRMLLIK